MSLNPTETLDTMLGLLGFVCEIKEIPAEHGLTLACVFGSIVYHVIVALALNATTLGLTASDVNFVTAALVCLALAVSGKTMGAGRVRPA